MSCSRLSFTLHSTHTTYTYQLPS